MRADSCGAGAVVLAVPSPHVGRFPEIHANHVALAVYMRSWSLRMEPELSAVGRLPGRSVSEDDYLLGYIRALRDMADHLVLGDALPGGPLSNVFAQSA